MFYYYLSDSMPLSAPDLPPIVSFELLLPGPVCILKYSGCFFSAPGCPLLLNSQGFIIGLSPYMSSKLKSLTAGVSLPSVIFRPTSKSFVSP